MSKNKHGKYFVNFTPAVSNMTKKTMQQEIRGWSIHLKSDKTLEDISNIYFNPILRGWVNYYGLFYKSEMYCIFKHINRILLRWAQHKYKRLTEHQRKASFWFGKIARMNSNLFIHWQMGIFSWTDNGSRMNREITYGSARPKGETPLGYSPALLLPLSSEMRHRVI
jgi:RNA-directed DNA polymerase